MRYHEDRATELFQVVFQPFDRVAVDVVRRLVQNQNITFIRENPCHGNAFSLATRQGAHFLLKIRNPKLIQHGFTFIFTLFRSLPSQITDRLFQHRFLRVVDRCLRQISDPHASGQNNLSGIGILNSCRNSQERGFACAVYADESDFIAFVYRIRKIRKKR